MKEIITKYLDKSYKMTLSSYVSYHLISKSEDKKIRPADVYKTLQDIFTVDQEELEKIYDTWAENQTIKLNNQITDIRYKLYETTGVELELTVFDLNRLINLQEDENSYMAEGLNNLDNKYKLHIP